MIWIQQGNLIGVRRAQALYLFYFGCNLQIIFRNKKRDLPVNDWNRIGVLVIY